MARFGSPIRRNAGAGLNPNPPGPQLSRRGRWVMTAFLLPGIAAIVTIPFLPASDQTGAMWSIAGLSFVGGLAAALTAFPWAFLHAVWTPALRPAEDDSPWSGNGGAVAVVVGIALTAAYLAAAVRFGLWLHHSWAELAPAVLFLVAGVVHLVLTLARRTGQKPPEPA